MTPKNIFLIDGIGAMFTALMAGVVLPLFQMHIGMPLRILYALAALGFAFGVFSLTSYWLSKHPAKALRLIVVANQVYCVGIAACVAVYFEKLTALGVAYFLAEIVVVSALVVFEKKSSRLFSQE
ncbi:MAG: hypothetical protein V4692_16415 [Bdellovibrionota bacterium]